MGCLERPWPPQLFLGKSCDTSVSVGLVERAEAPPVPRLISQAFLLKHFARRDEGRCSKPLTPRNEANPLSPRSGRLSTLGPLTALSQVYLRPGVSATSLDAHIWPLPPHIHTQWLWEAPPSPFGDCQSIPGP